MKKNNQIHGFHLVDPSPWPIIAAFSALMMTVSYVMYMHGYYFEEIYVEGILFNLFAFIMILFVMFVWWRDVIREATYEGQHTSQVQKGLRMGMVLFIISEVMFFFAFFWAFFHSSLNPNFYIGGVWPPMFLTTLDPWKLPLLNTLILLTSGASITQCHHYLVWGELNKTTNLLMITIALGFFFSLLQRDEYLVAPFSISDGIYGSTFYMATGFHGFHVFVGICFLCVCCFRLQKFEFTREHHFGFEAAAWYWHFVDVVWLFLFLTIYWWGS